MINNANLENILTNATDLSVVCEIYDADATPTSDGFDPHDALGCFAMAAGITFQDQTYQRLISRFGKINKTIGSEVNNAQVTFSNVTREIADFEFTHGFEGLIMVIRTLSRSQSIALTDTKIEFAGRCDKPDAGDKESLTVSAKFILGSIDVNIPRRKFGPDDMEGRVVSDPEFEGFIFMPQYGTTSYERRERRSFLFFHWHKTVRYTLQWSSYSNLDANKPVPEILGRAQLMGVLIGAADVGTIIQMRVAFCEGEISDFTNVRTTDNALPFSLSTNYAEDYGKVGTLNTDNPSWVAPGYYSRTAYIRGQADNSAVDVVEPAPDLVAVILGRLMATPDSSNVWSGSVWSDNPAAHVRFLLTSDDYYKLDDAWIDDDEFGDSYFFNDELIFNSALSDFIFVEEG